MKPPIERKPDQTLADYINELSDVFCVMKGCVRLDNGNFSHADDCVLPVPPQFMIGIDPDMNLLGLCSEELEEAEIDSWPEPCAVFSFPVHFTQDELEREVRDQIENPMSDEEITAKLEGFYNRIQKEIKKRCDAGEMSVSPEELEKINKYLAEKNSKMN